MKKSFLAALALLALAPFSFEARAQTVVNGPTVVSLCVRQASPLTGCTIVDAAHPLVVSATITPSGTQDINLTQVGGSSLSPTNPVPVSAYPVTSTLWRYAAATGGIVNTTTAVTVKTAAGASLKNCISSAQVYAGALGVATELVIRDGAAGTVVWRAYIGTSGLSGIPIVMPSGVCGTANTLLEVATLTASVTGGVYVNLQGYTAP